jgi:hypothetical protein
MSLVDHVLAAQTGREELEVWESFLSVETPDDREIAEKWNKAVSNVINKRVQDTGQNNA